MFIRALHAKVLALAAAAGTALAGAPYCLPGDACFPGADALAALNATVGGRLIRTEPYGAACYAGPSYDAARCREMAGELKDKDDWRVSLPAAVMYSQLEQDDAGNGCPLPDDPTAPVKALCTLGSMPSYVVNATGPDAVGAAVRFAAQHNLRLRVKSSGHDYAGRSVGAGALSIWTRYMNDTKTVADFTPEGCSCRDDEDGARPRPQFVVSMGAGVSVGELYEWAGDNEKVTVNGFPASVGAAGGYVLGGGLGPLASRHGMAVDNVLQFEVVTADGIRRIANECQNQDLFWALRGGGGAFGVVTRVWLKAHEPLRAVNLMGGSITCDSGDSYGRMMSVMIRSQARLHDAGHVGVWQASSDKLMWAGLDMLPVGSGSGSSDKDQLPPPPEANATLAEYEPMTSVAGCKASLKTWQFRGRKSLSDAYAAVVAPFSSSPGAVGGNYLDSARVLSQASARDPAALDRVVDFALALPPNVTFLWNANAGGAVNDVHPDATAVHPAWRDAMAWIDVHVPGPWTGVDAPQQTVFEAMQPLLDAAVGGAVYYGENRGLGGDNDASPSSASWANAYFGANYPRLLRIKRAVDPRGVFSCRKCVGSEFGI